MGDDSPLQDQDMVQILGQTIIPIERTHQVIPQGIEGELPQSHLHIRPPWGDSWEFTY